jgi:hypothetical protein
MLYGNFSNFAGSLCLLYFPSLHYMQKRHLPVKPFAAVLDALLVLLADITDVIGHAAGTLQSISSTAVTVFIAVVQRETCMVIRCVRLVAETMVLSLLCIL